MVFGQFFTDSTGWNGTDFSGPVKTIPACGSDGIVHCDGRKTTTNQLRDAIDCGKNVNARLGHRFTAVQLFRGERYSDAKPITSVTPL